MPTYVYEKPDGTEVSLVMTVAEMDRRQNESGIIELDDGTKAHRVWRLNTTPSVPATTGWPRKSNALGVGVEQVKEAEESHRKLGVPTNFDPKTGQAIVRDSRHQKKLCKVLGYTDRDSYL